MTTNSQYANSLEVFRNFGLGVSVPELSSNSNIPVSPRDVNFEVRFSGDYVYLEVRLTYTEEHTLTIGVTMMGNREATIRHYYTVYTYSFDLENNFDNSYLRDVTEEEFINSLTNYQGN